MQFPSVLTLTTTTLLATLTHTITANPLDNAPAIVKRGVKEIKVNNLGVHNANGIITTAGFFIEDDAVICTGNGTDLYKEGVIGCQTNYWSFFIQAYDVYNYKLGIYLQTGTAVGIYNIVNVTLQCDILKAADDYECFILEFLVQLTPDGPN